MNWYGTSNSWEGMCGFHLERSRYWADASAVAKARLRYNECAKFSAMGKKVLIVQREDDAGLVKAKLQCMGAALGNIMLYKRYDHETEYCGFDARDLQGIVESAGRMRADLVYIDPLHGLAAGRMNDQRSADCLIALDAMAKRNNCCVLGVLHAKKDPEDVSYAISGSDQWVPRHVPTSTLNMSERIRCGRVPAGGCVVFRYRQRQNPLRDT